MCESEKVLTVLKSETEGLKHVICGCEACKAIWDEYTAIATGHVTIGMIEPQDVLPKGNRAASPDKRLCPVCGSSDTSAGFNGRVTIEGERVDMATAGCHICAALWTEAYHRRSGRTVISDIQPKGLAAALAADKAKAAAPKAAHEDGCPVCGSLHIGLKPYGPGVASCTCTDCHASWDHRYDSAEERVYRTNIKTPG